MVDREEADVKRLEGVVDFIRRKDCRHRLFSRELKRELTHRNTQATRTASLATLATRPPCPAASVEAVPYVSSILLDAESN